MKLRLLVVCVVIMFVRAANAQQLVMPGDHADPSVVKIGDFYYATATSSNWAPAFPLLKSKDLVNWETIGHVFPQLPEWADYYFWAPEISYDNGKVYIYYTAHKKGGNLCVAAAVADKPEGPYKDLGPLMCEADGSIDGFAIRDEKGKLHLVWKEDGNSVNQPTPIWCMEMAEDRTKLIGQKKELFRNDVPWEGNLVEGVSIVQHNGYFLAFYAAAACCGMNCSYGIGVARSKNLNGPWEKYHRNPILTSGAEWACPGHGTPIQKGSDNYFLFHGYNKKSTVFTGREALLMKYEYTDDNWVRFIPSENKDNARIPDINDPFNGHSLGVDWEWSVFEKPEIGVSNGVLSLNGGKETAVAFIGQKTLAANYTASTKILNTKSSAKAGIALIGDEKNLIYLAHEQQQLMIGRVADGREEIVQQKKIGRVSSIWLKAEVKAGNTIRFAYSTNGKDYAFINETGVDASRLPPWDRSIRVGLISKGDSASAAAFDFFKVSNTVN